MMNAMEVIGRGLAPAPIVKKRGVEMYAGALCFCVGLGLFTAGSLFGQQPTPPPAAAAQKPQTANPATPAAVDEGEQPLPGDWGPELLYGILNSPNQEAQFGLMRAAFAAGPAIIPLLTEALKDDRTAEFAAQSIAFIGTQDALPVLEKLVSDPRDLNLRRFTYGALGEFDSPQATDMLFDVINKSDSEPDRTVTEAAIIALTVRTDPSVLTRINDAEKKLQDIVIHDDLDNARMVIEERAKFLASARGKKSGISIDAAVRTYFLPALEQPSEPPTPPAPTSKSTLGKTPPAPAPPALKIPTPGVTVEVRSVTLSPDKDRALARVVFQDPTAIAFYDFVLQKHLGNWELASVWLGPEMEKPASRETGQGIRDKEPSSIK